MINIHEAIRAAEALECADVEGIPNLSLLW